MLNGFADDADDMFLQSGLIQSLFLAAHASQESYRMFAIRS